MQNVANVLNLQMSELKRANNLLTEQDFYGLKVIRIPVSKYSSVHETVVDEQAQQPSTSTHLAAPLPNNFQLTDKLISISDDDEVIVCSLIALGLKESRLFYFVEVERNKFPYILI